MLVDIAQEVGEFKHMTTTPEPIILPHHGIWPRIHKSCFIAPGAAIVGEVEIGEQSSVWFNSVIRGDVNWIRIGSRTNIQDLTMCHVTRKTRPLQIGDEVTVGHSVVLHGCTIGNQILVGMGAVIMDGAVISDRSVVGAGALITEGKTFPEGSLIMGSPAKVIRALKPEELEFLPQSAANYVADSESYLNSSQTI